MKRLFTTMCVALLCASALSSFADLKSYHQLGFAHRVNEAEDIRHALNAGANGIEIDICWSSSKKRWYVSHNDLNVCANLTADSLYDWMRVLKSQDKSHPNTLVALWVDIKSIDEYHRIPSALDIIHNSGLSRSIYVIYDLTAYKHSRTRKVLSKIHKKLRANEGVSLCWGGSNCRKEDVSDIEALRKIKGLYKEFNITGGGINSGHSVNIDEDFIALANNPEFHNPSDPYRFKFVHTWTNKLEDSIADHVDQSKPHRTSGQIVGNFSSAFGESSKKYIKRFRNVVKKFPDQHLATKHDPILGNEFGQLKNGEFVNRCMDLGNNTNGTALALWKCKDERNQNEKELLPLQLFSFYADGSIRAASNMNMCFDPTGPSYNENTELQVWECKDEFYEWHMWQRNLLDFTIRPLAERAKDMCLTATGNGEEGANIVLRECDGSKRQQWYFERDFKQYKSQKDKKYCLNLRRAQATDGNYISTWTCYDLDNMRFSFGQDQRVRTWVNPNKCFSPLNGAVVNDSPIKIQECDLNDIAQGFEKSGQQIKPTIDSSLCLDIDGGAMKDDSEIQLWHCHGHSNQKWDILP